MLVDGRPRGLARAWHTGSGEGAALALEFGDRAWASGALKDAEAAYALAEELSPEAREVLLRRASVADLLGPRDVQRRCLEALIRGAEVGSVERLRAQARLLWALTRTADVEEATALGEEVLSLAEALGEEGIYTSALVDLANVAIQRGEYARGEARLLEARRRTDENQAPGDAARIANNLGNILSYRGESEDALKAYGEALRLKELEGDPVGARIATGNMGLMCLRLGRSGEALGHFARSLRSARSISHRRGEAWCLLAIAVLGLKGGALSFAERRARAALALAARLGDRSIACDARCTLAEVLAAQGKEEQAVAEAEQGLHEASELDIGYSISVARAVLARLLSAESPGRARSLASSVLEESAAHPSYRASSHCVLAELEMEEGRVDAAWQHMRQALDESGNAADERIWLVALQVLPLAAPAHELPELTAKVRAALREREDAWPETPCDDGVDEAAGVDGPSRATWRQRRSVVSLKDELERAAATGGRLTEVSPGPQEGREMSHTEDPYSAWHELLVDGPDAQAAARALCAEIVAQCGAERAFLVEGAQGVLASSDLDGDVITDAGRKAPLELIHQAERAGGIWRGQSARGALWCACLTSESGETFSIILENRFDANAFKDLRVVPQRGRVRLLFHLRSLGRSLKTSEEQAQRAEDARMKEAERSTMHMMELRRALEATREQLGPKKLYSEIIYDSALMQRMLMRVEKVVDSDLPVWIAGESGTGKELVARALHRHGKRAKGPFVAQYCGAIPASLFESEFFGHVRGAFTGAHKDQEGLFRRADGGTLFLDEVGDLPLEQQTKLLRVIETGEVTPVGSSNTFKVDVRLVCATHQDLKEKVSAGTFREDLYYRLNVVKLDVPALRDRPEDIPLLVEHFLGKEIGGQEKGPALGTGVRKALMAHSGPGNVRVLENELMRASILCDGGAIALGDLSETVRNARSRPVTAGEGDHLATLGLTSGTL